MSWLTPSKPVYQILLGVGAIVSAAGLGMSIAQAVRQDIGRETVLLIVGLAFFVAATAIHHAHMRARIEALRNDIRDKDGYSTSSIMPRRVSFARRRTGTSSRSTLPSRTSVDTIRNGRCATRSTMRPRTSTST